MIDPEILAALERAGRVDRRRVPALVEAARVASAYYFKHYFDDLRHLRTDKRTVSALKTIDAALAKIAALPRLEREMVLLQVDNIVPGAFAEWPSVVRKGRSRIEQLLKKPPGRKAKNVALADAIERIFASWEEHAERPVTGRTWKFYRQLFDRTDLIKIETPLVDGTTWTENMRGYADDLLAEMEVAVRRRQEKLRKRAKKRA